MDPRPRVVDLGFQTHGFHRKRIPPKSVDSGFHIMDFRIPSLTFAGFRVPIPLHGASISLLLALDAERSEKAPFPPYPPSSPPPLAASFIIRDDLASPGSIYMTNCIQEMTSNDKTVIWFLFLLTDIFRFFLPAL